MVLDGEVLPWSAKTLPLIQSQYAAVGAAGRLALAGSVQTLEQAASRGAEVTELLERSRSRAAMLEQYRIAYGAYCWPVKGLDDVRFAPFHLLASEGGVHIDRTHLWHMETLASMAAAGPALCRRTEFRQVEVGDERSVTEAVEWWLQLTGAGGEGMVIKPLDFVSRGRRGLLQPGLKCRGREYLRIIYGPEYTEPDRLERLRHRNTRAKGALALREFALGVEALQRFVRREPLRRVHECVFAVLALESEPVDPRL
jgi:protein phosphatase